MNEQNTVEAGVKLKFQEDLNNLNVIDHMVETAHQGFKKLENDLSRSVMSPLEGKKLMPASQAMIRDAVDNIRHLSQTLENSPEHEALMEKFNIFTGTSFGSTKAFNKEKRRIDAQIKDYDKYITETVKQSIDPLTSKDSLIRKHVLGSEGAAELELEARRQTRIVTRGMTDEWDKVIETKEGEVQSRKRFMQSYLASSIYSLAGIGTSWGRYAAGEQTAFDLSSPEAMYSARKQYEIAGTRLKYQTVGQGAGMVGGGLLALLMAGGASMTGGIGGLAPLLFPYIGSQLGGDIGGMFGEFPAKAEERDLKIKTEMGGFGRQGLAAWGSYDIPAARLRARFGGNVRGLGANIGYSDDQMTQFAYQYGSQGAWSKDAFYNSMVFERAQGLTPGSTFGMNQMSQFTGQATGDYSNVYRYADSMKSMDRLPQIMEKMPQIMSMIANISGVQANKIMGQTEELMNFPRFIFENENYQNIGKQGMQGIQALQGLFQPSTPAGEFMMMKAMGLGKRPIWEVWERSKRGITGEGGLENLKDMVAELRGNVPDERLLPSMLSENFQALSGVSMDLLKDLAHATSNVDFKEVQRKIEKETGGKWIDFTEQAMKNKSGTEDYNTTIQNHMIATGEAIKDTERTAALFFTAQKSAFIQSARGLKMLKEMYDTAMTELDDLIASLIGKERITDPTWGANRQPTAADLNTRESLNEIRRAGKNSVVGKQ